MAEYPLPRFHYQVDWGGSKISFTEVTGLDMQVEVIEYRHSDSKEFSSIKQPGRWKSSNITLKRGTFEEDTDYYDWIEEIRDNRTQRRDVIIRLLNEKHETVKTWRAARCFPVKVQASDLKSDANEVAIETLEIAHEGLSISK